MTNDRLVGCRVLVVEDDYLLASDMAAMLEQAGARVIGPAGNVADAFDALKGEPEVAVLDLRLGEELSLPVADELKRRGVPFVFATGSTNDLPSRHHAFAICSKPTNDAEVRKALVGALEACA